MNEASASAREDADAPAILPRFKVSIWPLSHEQCELILQASREWDSFYMEVLID